MRWRAPIHLKAMMMIRYLLIALILGFWTSMSEPALAADEVQFRDLFFQGGKPSPKAERMAGQVVTLSGFLAPPPEETSPFLVLVGVPVAKCPYCATEDDEEQLPFVLVYPDTPFDRAGVRARTRIRVQGRVETGEQYDPTFGLPNSVRIIAAQIERDMRMINPVQLQLRSERIAARPKAAPIADE